MMIYRPGAITADQIREIAGPVEIFRRKSCPHAAAREALPSPGVGLRHYAPRARLILVEGTLAELPSRLDRKPPAARQESASASCFPPNSRTSILEAPLRAAAEFAWGRWSAPEELAEKLYAGLRALDAQGCDVILCPLPEPGGIGDAIRDRLRKAAHSG